MSLGGDNVRKYWSHYFEGALGVVRTFFYVTLEIFFSHHFLNSISLMWFSLSSVKNLQKELV